MVSDQVLCAEKLFNDGYNCAQSVLASGCAEYGLDEQSARSLTECLGGGVNRQGRTCGAVLGALILIGLKHGRKSGNDTQAKDLASQKGRVFLKLFEERNGATLCRELLGCDISTPEGHAEAAQANKFTEECPRFVRDAVEIVKTILA